MRGGRNRIDVRDGVGGRDWYGLHAADPSNAAITIDPCHSSYAIHAIDAAYATNPSHTADSADAADAVVFLELVFILLFPQKEIRP